MSNRSRRVALVYPWPTYDSCASVANAALQLAASGYVVDLFVQRDPSFLQPQIGTSVNVIPLPGICFRFGRAIAARSALPIPHRLRELVALLMRPLVSGIAMPLWFSLRSRHEPYSFIVGYDPEGLVAARALARFTESPAVYYSLELLVEKECDSRWLRMLKRRERVACDDCVGVIVQDEERGAVLLRGLPMAADCVYTVPNSAMGPARRANSDYMRAELGIGPGATILLCAGSITPWSMSLELAEAARALPEDVVLVLHSRTRVLGPYGRAVADAASRSGAIFSTVPLTSGEYERFVSGADVGVAVYRPLYSDRYDGENLRLMGLSSGKVNECMRLGKPVVVLDAGGLGQYLERNNAGAAIGDLAELPAAVASLMAQYDAHSDAAVALHNEQLEYGLRFSHALAAIEARILGRGELQC